MMVRSSVVSTRAMFHAVLPAVAYAFFSPKTAFVPFSNLPARSSTLRLSRTIPSRGLASTQMNADLKVMVQKLIDENPVMVFSKTYCPYCNKAKKTLDSVSAKYQVLELDKRNDGANIQDIMGELTGARSVPRVFINGKFVGGGDDVVAKAASGELQRLLSSKA